MRIMKTRINVINILALLLLLMPIPMMAQSDWVVSEEMQKDKNPIAFSEESVNAGKTIYMANCKSCHGDPTKNNVLAALNPKPTDLGLQAFLDINTNGSIFHKITEGKATMPQFGSILSEDDRWNVVNYIRSFDANFEAAAIEQSTEEVAQGDANGEFTAPFELSLSVDQSNHKAVAKLKGTQEGQLVAMPNTEVFLSLIHI